MSDEWNAEQNAYGCGAGRYCGCRTEEQRAAAEQKLAAVADRAAEVMAEQDAAESVDR